MNHTTTPFDERHCLHELAHYLPAQASLKDFVHHNTLHAFQDRPFFDALVEATQTFGYKSSLSLKEYRAKFAAGEISEAIVEKVIAQRTPHQEGATWKEKMLTVPYEDRFEGRIGSLRSQWKQWYSLDPDRVIHPFLFRFLCSYLDQGIAIHGFPEWKKGFLAAVCDMERHSYSSFFHTPRARRLLLDDDCSIPRLLQLLVNDESLYEQYLFDQQFSHAGWSGLVSVIERQPQTLLNRRGISLRELIVFELLLEIDALDHKFGENWIPLGLRIPEKPQPLFQPAQRTDYHDVLRLWQEAMEWTFYDPALRALQENPMSAGRRANASFQALFCIDDREGSLRRYVHGADPHAETFGTPGHFGLNFYYQPMDGKFSMKVCPAPVTPVHLVKEESDGKSTGKDIHFTRQTHGLLLGYLITHSIGFWSAVKLFFNIFVPRLSPASTSSFRHMDRFSHLTVEHIAGAHSADGLQVGFTVEEMIVRVEGVLKSIGLVDRFAPLVYVVSHGASSVNNTHYAGYDCGACSGRPGSVNARVFSYMANDPRVREGLADRGIAIPHGTLFVGCMHDTTRDEMEYYDDTFPDTFRNKLHQQHKAVFEQALSRNAKERARRLETTRKSADPKQVHESVKLRSVSLFEPRPELNHATNALCIVGGAHLTDGVFLDRRAFMNSYDHSLDPSGDYLFQILSAAAPVCGGINLEYFFSRVDNQKLGAGSKLPHNVMGLIGVANGIDGDLRPGLPLQMIEVHDPIRILIIVENHPDMVLSTIQRTPQLYEWFLHEWVQLVAIEPVTKTLHHFDGGQFRPYQPTTGHTKVIADVNPFIESTIGNLPVFLIHE